MTLEQFYAALDGDLNGVLQRIPGKAFLLKMLKKFAMDPSKASLDQAVEAGDATGAFRAIHTMKGVTLSLGLSALARPCETLTEKLRSGVFGDGWETDYRELCTKYDQTLRAIETLES